MSSQFDALYGGSAGQALLDLHGRTVTRWPSGLQEYATSVTAMWAPVSSGNREASINEQSLITRGTLTVTDNTTCDHRDSWLIDGVRYTTEAVGPATSGLRYIQVTRATEQTTSRQMNVR